MDTLEFDNNSASNLSAGSRSDRDGEDDDDDFDEGGEYFRERDADSLFQLGSVGDSAYGESVDEHPEYYQSDDAVILEQHIGLLGISNLNRNRRALSALSELPPDIDEDGTQP